MSHLSPSDLMGYFVEHMRPSRQFGCLGFQTLPRLPYLQSGNCGGRGGQFQGMRFILNDERGTAWLKTLAVGGGGGVVLPVLKDPSLINAGAGFPGRVETMQAHFLWPFPLHSWADAHFLSAYVSLCHALCTRVGNPLVKGARERPVGQWPKQGLGCWKAGSLWP